MNEKYDKYNHEYWALIDQLVSESRIVIDRPKNTCHPKYKDMIYPLDYGYLEGTTSSDKGGIDVWVGTGKEQRVTAVISSIDIIKKDSEIKLLYACTPKEIELIYETHNKNSGMKGLINIRPDMSM